jgi:thioredoxin reductase (NADPH)
MKVSFSSFTDKIVKFYFNNKIKKMNSYDYDFFVIGGGSGGLSASKQAASLGKKVALADFVKPTPIGTKWGIGGTCVNVGCIPKKMMHHSGMMYESLSEIEKIGYPEKVPKKHDWTTMVNNVQNYIKKLNFGYKFALKKKMLLILINMLN